MTIDQPPAPNTRDLPGHVLIVFYLWSTVQAAEARDAQGVVFSAAAVLVVLWFIELGRAARAEHRPARSAA